MSPPRSRLTLWWLLAFGLTAAALLMVLFGVPADAAGAPVRRLLFLHVPAAANIFVACGVAFVAGVGYLWQRHASFDALGPAAAKVAVLLCSIVLLSGMVWARQAWGHWWVWSPRLTFSLVLWLLYIAYLAARPAIRAPERRAAFSAVFGVIAFLDVPLVYASVKLLPDVHPDSLPLDPATRPTLVVCLVAATALTVGLIATNFTRQRRRVGRAPASRARAAAPGLTPAPARAAP